MKIAPVIAAALLGLIFAAPAHADEADARRAADIAALTDIKVNEWRRIYAERDADALEKFLGDDFVVLSPVGVVSTKADEIAYLRDTPRDTVRSDFVYTIKDILFQDDDVAVIFGHGDSTRQTDDGAPCHHRYWSSNTLARVDGEWKALFSHVSDAACTPLEE